MKKSSATNRPAGYDPAAHPTIGLLCDQLADEYSIGMWAGVRDAAREHEVRLLSFCGGTLMCPWGFEAHANMLYELVDSRNLDGLVLWGAQLAHHTTFEELRKFCERYRPLPIANIGLALPGIPSLLVDNRQGMHDVVTHLIEAHGYRRIAYLHGPGDTPESRDRYGGYTDALAEHGLALDPSLVAAREEMAELYRQSIESGEGGVRILVDRRKLRPKTDFDAIVGHDDGTSRVVLTALHERGFSVPADVAVASFDDLEDSRFLFPPLTTARQSFYDLGRRGCEMLLAQLRGETVPEQIVLPMKVIVRQSCGCLDPAVTQSAAGSSEGGSGRKPDPKQWHEALSRMRAKVIADMAHRLRDSESTTRSVEKVLDAFIAEVTGKSRDGFLTALSGVLDRMMETDGGPETRAPFDVGAWQGVISEMRRDLLPGLGDKAARQAEDLWQQARVMIGETAQRVQAYHVLQAEQRARTLREIGGALITTFDMAELMSTLADGLPRLGIPSAYLSLYEDPQPYTYPQPAPAESRLMMAYDEGGRTALPADGRRFPSRELMPGGVRRPEKLFSFVIIPLYFREHQLGFALLEVGTREGRVYETLRGEISNSLFGALLLRERQRAEKALLAAQEQLVRREKLAVLGQLAATVSHEIRNPLATIRVSANALDKKVRDQGLGVERALDRIQRNITRCDNIITELLEYARIPELNLQSVDFDDWLNRLLDEQTMPAEIALIREISSGVTLAIDPERFRRVIINLVDNARQAMQAATPTAGAARILTVQAKADAHDLTVVISDTGPGIPPDVMPHLFEPLYSTKDFGAGLGLSVVKGIIEQHGGAIAITSSAGKGTQAVIRLPVSRKENAHL